MIRKVIRTNQDPHALTFYRNQHPLTLETLNPQERCTAYTDITPLIAEISFSAATKEGAPLFNHLKPVLDKTESPARVPPP